MAKVIAQLGNPQGKLADVLGMSLGQGLGNGLNTFFANRSLDSVLHDKALEGAPQSKKLEALRAALSPYGEKGQEIFNQRMQIEQQEMNEAQQDVLGRVVEGQKVPAKDLARLSPENQLKVMQIQKNRQIGRSVYESLVKAGYPEETAKIWQGQMENAPTGGQSDVIRQVNDLIKRSPAGKGVLGNESVPEEDAELQNIISNQDEGLTPSEKVKRESERFKTGQPVREEAASKIRGFTRDKERLGILESLNESKKLPKNFGLINVDKEGNLRLPFAASPEAQRFIKTLNEFSASAKDTYGSRVTNFDLAQYMKRFPTLLNSDEGRKQILDQMKIVNDINAVYYKNLQDIFSKAGGARRIDADTAQDLADRKSEQTINELVKRFEEIGTFGSQPAASQFKGRKIRDKKTGEILVSDGENWIPVQ
jgi:hypothetical protein